MEYEMKGGYKLTSEDFDRLGEACEQGNYPGTPGEWVVRPQGRPSLCDEELVTIAFKVPASERRALDSKANSRGESRSEYLRGLVEKDLAS